MTLIGFAALCLVSCALAWAWSRAYRRWPSQHHGARTRTTWVWVVECVPTEAWSIPIREESQQ